MPVFEPPKIQMPKFYRPGPKPGLELPLYWRDDMTGILVAAVNQYLAFRVDGAAPPTPEQFELFRDYLEHYINAPAWATTCKDAFDDELASLRERVKRLRLGEVGQWILTVST